MRPPTGGLTPDEQEALAEFFWAHGRCRRIFADLHGPLDRYEFVETNRYRRAKARAYRLFGFSETGWRRRVAPAEERAA